MQHVEPNVA